MRRLYCPDVRGRSHEWGLNVVLDEASAADMIADGVDLGEVMYRFPEWLPSQLIPAWCRIQDFWNLRWS